MGNTLTPIHLIDGQLLADLLTEHGIGIQSSRLSLLSLDLDALATITGRTENTSQSARSRASSSEPRYYIEKMPSDRDGRRLLDAIVTMIALADGQPAWDAYIASFQRHFPTITRPDEARRRSRVLISLGLVDIENGHMNLTLTGRRLLENPDAGFVHEIFVSRVAGAQEIQELTQSLTRAELRIRLRTAPPAGLSPTQAVLVEKWLNHLKRSTFPMQSPKEVATEAS